MKRREFIVTTSMATAASLFSCAVFEGASRPIGIQLYTLRDILPKDVKGTLEKVAAIGYKQLEAYDYNEGKIFGMTYQDFTTLVKDLGMEIISGHYSTGYGEKKKGTLRTDWESAVVDAKEASMKYMVIPSLYAEERASIDALKEVCEQLNKGGEVCQKHGIRIGFHNHADEFKMIDNQLIYDVMLQELDPKLVAMELDLYWITYGGSNPMDYFRKYPGRFELWHVKDMDQHDKGKTPDIGTGIIDFKTIFAEAEAAGMKHFFVEQESFDKPPIESITNGFAYLQSIK